MSLIFFRMMCARRLPSCAGWKHGESVSWGQGKLDKPSQPQTSTMKRRWILWSKIWFESTHTWYKKQQSPSFQREPVNLRGLCVTRVCWVSLVMKIIDPQILNKLEGKNPVNMMAWSYHFKNSCICICVQMKRRWQHRMCKSHVEEHMWWVYSPFRSWPLTPKALNHLGIR